MSKLIRNAKKKFARMERGQVLILVTLAAVGIIAIVGLALDVGLMFIEDARLRRAVDAAALSAALQVREGYTLEKLTSAATEFLALNGVTLDDDHPVTVDTCDTDTSMCYDAGTGETVPRKLVRVAASATVHLAFLPVIGIDNVFVSAEATSEAASVDVVLVIDRSESMTNDYDVGDPMRDPSHCNKYDADGNESPFSSCEPFKTVQDAAIGFVNQLFYPYDRVAIVTFDKTAHYDLEFDQNCPDPPCSPDDIENRIVSTIQGLTVFQGEETDLDPTGANAVYPNGNPSRCYGGDCLDEPDPVNYKLMNCTQIWDPNDPKFPDPSPCTTTNIGEALQVAGNEFAEPPIRQQALWVVILLTDGMANAGYFDEDGNAVTCPRDTWPDRTTHPIFCNDADSTTRHAAGDENYDADDYAYDMADFVALPASAGGQYAIIFTIGLGDLVRDDSFEQADGTYPGEVFLEYAATDHVSGDVGRGAYYYAPTSAELREIFRRIGDNIATRLTH